MGCAGAPNKLLELGFSWAVTLREAVRSRVTRFALLSHVPWLGTLYKGSAPLWHSDVDCHSGSTFVYESIARLCTDYVIGSALDADIRTFSLHGNGYNRIALEASMNSNFNATYS